LASDPVAHTAVEVDAGLKIGDKVIDSPHTARRLRVRFSLAAGVPDDISPMIAALLSDENRWINAQRIEVSGDMPI
jgi:hypothetical protein